MQIQDIDWSGSAAAITRRFFCVPAGPEEPHTLRQALHPLAILFTLGYLGLLAREFLWGQALAPRGLSPNVYCALLGIFTADQEVRRWTGKPDKNVLEAEFIIYAWWLSYLIAIMAVNLAPAAGYIMPDDLRRVCVELLGIFGLKQGSAYVRRRKAGAPQTPAA